MQSAGLWEFAVDRGGTFTDCIALAPDGALHTAKILSSDAAPVAAIRALLERHAGLAPGAPLPPCRVRLGTTVATNALLERRGSAVALVANRGLGDVVAIGTQERPDLFALAIERPASLHARVLEVAGRVGARGERLEPLDPAAARRALEAVRAAGIDSLAIALIHAHAYPEDEARLAGLARQLGFGHVVAGHEIARELGLLARAETACVDAYLTPLLRRHVAELAAALAGPPAERDRPGQAERAASRRRAESSQARLLLMQSSGGLTDAQRFRGPTALLSGPAGGAAGAGRVARAVGCGRAIGFDMGGTSTDVSLILAGEVERAFETRVGGVRVRAPMLRIHTVAAGGGSLCRFDGFRLTVGPESAGADPGPLCYSRASARELTLTDANLALGRVQPDRFPFPLERRRAQAALAALGGELARAGHDLAGDALAAGLVAVANASMAQAIAEVSVARGVDPRGCALVGFGGAAGQHVCALARELGIATLLLHPLAGVLSAWGIAGAELAWDGQRDAGRISLGAVPPAAVRETWSALEREARAALAAEGAAPREVRVERLLDLRYAGSESALAVAEPASADFAAAFAAEHAARFGYTRPGRAIEIATARLSARAPSPGWRAAAADGLAPRRGGARAPEPLRHEPVWFPGAGRVLAPIHAREALRPGDRLLGPAVVLEDTGTLVLDPGFSAELGPEQILVLRDESRPARAAVADPGRPDPVRLEVFGNRFMSIAERMGAVLRNTSVSTNIKERLDYSCAVFDAAGGLVANAPHIPVHLGAMSETVCAVRDRFPELAPGDCVATNDPAAGGSHLPDVTVVTPVFAGGAEPAFFVASRGHHADIGGTTPGSMPADSRSLADEGVLIPPTLLVRAGRFEEERLRAILVAGPHPARSPADNLAELEAMVAANRAGERLLHELVAEHGAPLVATTMGQLQAAAAGKVAREIGRLPDGVYAFRDRMDDGTPVCVRLEIAGERMAIDFAGTGGVHPGNLNAPRAVVRAAVIYVLRALVSERIPLNGGCLDPVELRIPPGSLLDPPPGAAVVGGNVETSQRLVDVLLGALGKAAASQGTMNNVAFGDASFGYYETIGGGAGAGPGFAGASGVHVHMTNTRITDAEVLETRHPVRLLEFRLRRGSGGAGRWRGGDGLVRRYEFLAPVELSILSERRAVAPFGLAGGLPGAPGRNAVERRDGRVLELGGRARLSLEPGDRLRIETPGGGGFGAPEASPGADGGVATDPPTP